MFKTLPAYPKVSIIMPTYNRAHYILESIKSVQQQTHESWELIIIDDASEDNTEEIVVAVNDHRIQFYKSERTGIVGKLKNTGLDKSSGEVIAFLDSDDLWNPSKLEKQIEAMKAYPDAGFCMTGGYNFTKPEEPSEYFYKKKEGSKYGDIFISIFRSEIAGYTQALLLRRECLEQTGGFREVTGRTFTDIDFIVHLAWHFKAVVLFEPLVYRRLHESNYIHSTWEKSYYEGIEIIRENSGRLPVPVWKNALFQLYINFGEKCLLYKQRKKAVRQFLKAWVNKPSSLVPMKKISKSLFVIK
jgi:glycosyltransferase involved in cell wall biosynthesis